LSTNAFFALRGAPADYEAWAQLGNQGRGFNDVLPLFRRLEADADFVDNWHGTDGPLPIRRYSPHELNSVQLAFI
jgi:choline dehydrogenase